MNGGSSDIGDEMLMEPATDAEDLLASGDLGVDELSAGESDPVPGVVDAEAEAAAYALAEADDDALEDLSDLDSRRLAEVDDGGDGHDPVRMYLREIGSTPLLTADQELRTCATFGAEQLAERLRDIANDRSHDKNSNFWRMAYDYLWNSWMDAMVECKKRKVDPPELPAILRDARNMPLRYTDPSPSDVQLYLRALGWGQDLTVETISKPLYEVVLSAIVFPQAFIEQLEDHFGHTGELPEWDEARAWMPSALDCEDHLREIALRASEARDSLSRSNLRLVVQHRQALHRARHLVPGPDPGRQHGPAARHREVRLRGAASSSARMPPGGFARPSAAASPTRRAPSAFRCTWWRRSTSSRACSGA